MEAIFILVPVSLMIVFIALMTFVWSVRHHQFDDLDKEASRILFEDEDASTENDHPDSEINNKA